MAQMNAESEDRKNALNPALHLRGETSSREKTHVPVQPAIGRLRSHAKAVGRSRTSKKRPIGVFH